MELTLEEKLEAIYCLVETWLEESKSLETLDKSCYLRLKIIKTLTKREGKKE